MNKPFIRKCAATSDQKDGHYINCELCGVALNTFNKSNYFRCQVTTCDIDYC